MRSALLTIGLAAILLSACGERPHRLASEAEPQATGAEHPDLSGRAMRQSESTRIYH